MLGVEAGAVSGGSGTLYEVEQPEGVSTGGPTAVSGGYAPGAQVLIREDLWLVRKCNHKGPDGWMIEVTGVSPFVRGRDAVFYDGLDVVQKLDPRETELVPDDSPNHRRSRLYLEAIVRKTFLPQTEHGLALADNFLMDRQVHQLRPAELALSMKNPQPRILIADVVGLGKTLEIGVLLAELIRRGRGERILVVTPQHVLEQFQRELWTRFGIPLVRLDSTGIQRVQRDIPAGRNPFAYFKRVIISVDTLKSDVYAHHLEHTDWDAVVIDESHNLVNRGTKNNALARTLAGRTDALVLASATPHNGDAVSFAELVRMLDEAAIANPAKYEVGDLQHLYIRRTKTSPEVRESLGDNDWADRGPSRPIHVAATPKELAVLRELATRWIPADPSAPSVSRQQLVPYRLLKSFLSSHKALLATIKTRIGNLDNPPAEKSGKPGSVTKRRTRPEDPAVREAARKTERAALVALRQLVEQIQDEDSAKLAGLVQELGTMGVGPGSETRVVVFSESIPTLRWLAEAVPDALGFPRAVAPGEAAYDEKKPWSLFGGAVQVMHGDATTDQEQQDIVEKFGLRDDPVRILFTGDVASEGVNLHQQCHQLFHWDLPWSLIRIEQRNGRIDRYGQKLRPEFRALILTGDVPWRTDATTGQPRTLDDRLVGEKLLRREEEAHKIEGSAEGATGLYRAREEENRLTQDLIAGRTVEQSITQSRQSGAAFLAGLLGQVGSVPQHTEVARAVVPRLFPSTADYFEEALKQVCHPNVEDVLSLRRDNDGTIAFEPPQDLLYRLKALPKSYLDEQEILPRGDEPARMRITFSKELAARRLTVARETGESQWPNVSYVTDVHPVLDWLTDKVLVEIGRHKAPVLAADVTGPTYLVQGIYSNALGKPTIVEWMAASGLPDSPAVDILTEDKLQEYGIGANMAGRAGPRDLPGLSALVPAAIDAAERYLAKTEVRYREQIEATLRPHRDRVETWRQDALFASARPNEAELDRTAERRRKLVKSLETVGEPMLRLMAVLEPADDIRTAAEGSAEQ
ncbi:helicase [Streptomyces albus]|uniref:Helicase n=1 Tax=Streptomyces albus (strain ATCC 21838 / DSM 41398 / FERM P-419 / JCM 4703 / NBRC 107858) TaxID=1081613 RepID=A0A0B5EUX1_STRA4|nr:helicase [Streptomyces albus]AOU79877.1 helicase [Streptomyces albus]AYN35598.1 helicase [Streptomyces albus]